LSNFLKLPLHCRESFISTEVKQQTPKHSVSAKKLLNYRRTDLGTDIRFYRHRFTRFTLYLFMALNSL